MPPKKPSLPQDTTESTSPASLELSSLIGYRLLRLSTLIGNLAQHDSQEVAGLSLPEYRILVVLFSQGPSGVSVLQQQMLIDKAWISRTLAGLAAKKLVVSHADATDGRRTVFALTAAGKKSAQALITKAHARQQRILGGLSKTELKQLDGYLSRIHDNVAGSDAP